jgi:hypothetical protein
MLVLLKVENECLVGRDKIRAAGCVKQPGKTDVLQSSRISVKKR